MVPLREIAAAWLVAGREAVVVEVIDARGSVPRGRGTRMLVDASGTAGTVGGGHLEWKAIAEARDMLSSGDATPGRLHFPLGPALGQCCGGVVTLACTRLDDAALAAWPVAAPRFHLQLHGAGHVGRAIVAALAPLPVTVDWIDERDAVFDEVSDPLDGAGNHGPKHLRRVATDVPEDEVGRAPAGAYYLVLTHRHDLDLRIAMAVLERGDFGYFGLIGSATKRARFIHRFEARGLPAATIARMTCPIGLPGIEGKEPEVIAASVVAQMLAVRH